MKSPAKTRKITRGGDFLDTYLNYTQARDAAWQMLIDCHVSQLPVRLAPICEHYNWRLTSYADGARAVERLGLTENTTQTDGFCASIGGRRYIFFDDSLPRARERFTVAHEIGHIMLGHVGEGECTAINRDPSPQDAPEETQANQFAARILAPAIVLHELQLFMPEDIARECEISMPAAQFRAQRMAELERRGKYLTHPLERQVAEQFRSYIISRRMLAE